MKPLHVVFALVMSCVSAGEFKVFAEQIEIEYQAKIKTVANNFLGYTHAMDTAVTGSFVFETSLADSNISDANRGVYNHVGNGGFSATFNALNAGNPLAVTITGSGSPRVTVEYFAGSINDTWRFNDGLPNYGTMSVNGSPNADVDLGFSMSQPVIFASDANINPWPLVTFPGIPHTFALSDSNGTILLEITSATVVPEPGTLALLTVVAPLIHRRRRG